MMMVAVEVKPGVKLDKLVNRVRGRVKGSTSSREERAIMMDTSRGIVSLSPTFRMLGPLTHTRITLGMIVSLCNRRLGS